MTKKTATPKPASPPPPVRETGQEQFERILALEQFQPLKAVLNQLSVDTTLMRAAIVTTNSYPYFLNKLGYRVELVKQIHEQDCYSRLGPAGGIRAVLPVHNQATYSTFVTLVNYDSTLTTTPNAQDFYDKQLADFKTQLMSKSNNPVSS